MGKRLFLNVGAYNHTVKLSAQGNQPVCPCIWSLSLACISITNPDASLLSSSKAQCIFEVPIALHQNS